MPAVAFADTAGSPGSSAGPGPSASGKSAGSPRGNPRQAPARSASGASHSATKPAVGSRPKSVGAVPDQVMEVPPPLTSRAGKRGALDTGARGHEALAWTTVGFTRQGRHARQAWKSPPYRQPHPRPRTRRGPGRGAGGCSVPIRERHCRTSRRRDSGRKRLLLELVDVHRHIGLQRRQRRIAGQRRQRL